MQWICIRIRKDVKFEIRIRWKRILAGAVTFLLTQLYSKLLYEAW